MDITRAQQDLTQLDLPPHNFKQHDTTCSGAQSGLVAIESQWLANFASECTRRAYAADVRDFVGFCGFASTSDLQRVGRAHVLAWRHHLQASGLSPSTLRRKLSALSSLLEQLVDEQLIPFNPSRGVRRPRQESREGRTPALSIEQARALLEAPDDQTLKGLRDRAILAVMLLAGLRRAEVVALKVRDFDLQRGGVAHLRVRGKGGKLRYLQAHPILLARVQRYLAARTAAALTGREIQDGQAHLRTADGGRSGAAGRLNGEAQLFVRVSALEADERDDQLSTSGPFARQKPPAALSAGGLAQRIVQPYLAKIGVVGERFSAHALRVTAATLALRERADLNEVRHFLGHACITTTTTYDRRWSDNGQAMKLTLAFV